MTCLSSGYMCQLLDDRSSRTSASTAYQYRPSLLTQMWHIVTVKLPPPIRFSNVIREANLLVKHIAPANASFIVVFLALWIILLRLLLLQCVAHPAFFVAVVWLGIYFLSVGDAKRKQAVRTSMNTSKHLEQFEIGEENMDGLSSSVLAYLECRHKIST